MAAIDTSHLMAERMLFLRIGWMNFYQGVNPDDGIRGAGSFVESEGYGHEIFNFLPFEGRVYGYARPIKGSGSFEHGSQIKLERIGGSKSDSKLDGVLVVWLAPKSSRELFVIGWFRNATVYRYHQEPPESSNRIHNGEAFGYYVTAAAADAVLLTPIERNFRVPHHEKGWIGQSNVWYADDPEISPAFRADMLRYIESRQIGPIPPVNLGGTPRQPDTLLRSQIEAAAIEITVAHFENRGYSVQSRERDNIGWDLEAKSVSRELKLEVKGLSGNQLVVELTPNEFAQMKHWHEDYCVCVVTEALTNPQLSVFSFNPISGRWQDERRRNLLITEINAARCSLE